MHDPSEPRPSPDEFTRRIAERFRIALPRRQVQIAGPLQLSIGLEAGTSEISLSRVFNFCATAPAEECAASIEHFIASQSEAIEGLDASPTADQLRIAVRNDDYVAHLGDGARPGGPMARAFLPGLNLLIVADYPNRTRSVSALELDRMGLSVEAAWSLAERQTLAGLPRPDSLDGLETSSVMLTDRRYLPSLLVDVEGWRLARKRHGDLLAAIPEGYAIFIARADRIGNLDALKDVVRDHYESAESPVSPTVFRFRADGWAPVE